MISRLEWPVLLCYYSLYALSYLPALSSALWAEGCWPPWYGRFDENGDMRDGSFSKGRIPAGRVPVWNFFLAAWAFL